ncbi:MAG: pyridoxamine 5'-phosphate oxidase family protein [Dehalococcoidaceae bacterium]|nr:pyridoxamine 5'-phosphate oxidase family protein [Dehalococcoidaceae bacterium]
MTGLSREREALGELLGSQKFGVLATDVDHQPYTNLIAYCVSEDLSFMLFATGRDTSKYRNISQNKKAAFLVDNSKNDQSDIEEAVAITAIGVAQEVEKDQALIRFYTNRHPALERFVRSKETALIMLRVSEYIIARFDTVTRVKP